MKLKAKAAGGPQAVWTAFAKQGAWKNYVMVAQLGTLVFALAVAATLVKTSPDVVVVGEDGVSHFIERKVADVALSDFLRQQRQKPSDVTVLAFTKRFVTLTSQVHSATIRDAWEEARQMMAPPLRTRMDAEAKSQKILETYELMQVRTRLVFKDVTLVQRVGDKSHVRVVAERVRERLSNTTDTHTEAIQVELVLVEVPRTHLHPDGLELLDWRTGAPSPSPASAGAPREDIAQ